jgi:hypothetical protein
MPQSSDDPTIEQLPEDPVIGDGVVTLPPEKEKKMPAVDLPESVASQLLTESIGSIQNNNRQGRDTFTLASGALQAGIAKTLNELGPVESRAVSGVMATPVAGPATSQVPG